MTCKFFVELPESKPMLYQAIWVAVRVNSVMAAAFFRYLVERRSSVRAHAAGRDMGTRSVCRYAVRGPTTDTHPW